MSAEARSARNWHGLTNSLGLGMFFTVMPHMKNVIFDLRIDGTNL